MNFFINSMGSFYKICFHEKLLLIENSKYVCLCVRLLTTVCFKKSTFNNILNVKYCKRFLKNISSSQKLYQEQLECCKSVNFFSLSLLDKDTILNFNVSFCENMQLLIITVVSFIRKT